MPKVDDFPIPVADKTEYALALANRAAEVIDAHLDHEAELQGIGMTPMRLCDEQRASLASDLQALSNQ